MKLTPYRKVAAAANDSWNIGMSQEEIETLSVDELDKNCDARGSMMAAIDKIAEILHLTDDQKERFAKCVFADDHAEIDEWDKIVYADIQKRWEKEVGENPRVVLDVLAAVHDYWVTDKARKFGQEGRENKRYQHLPIEMIGWKETKSDLLFVSPILEAIGVNVNEEVLEAYYDKRVGRFFAENGLNGQEELENYILNIADHYAPISDINNPKNTEKPEEIANQMADQVVTRLPLPLKEKVETENK